MVFTNKHRNKKQNQQSQSSNTELFLELYKRLEVAAKDEYGLRDGESALYYLANKRKEFIPYRTNLHIAREVRNLLQHNQKIKGKYPIEVAPELLICLKTCLDIIEKPIRAMKIAIPAEKLLCITEDMEVYPAYLLMLQHEFNHAPVVEKGRVVGVFSTDTIGQLFMESPQVDLSQLKFSDNAISKYLPLEAHKTEHFGFIKKTMLYSDIDTLFEKAYAEGNHFCMLFVTENGNAKERMLGLITSYDMAGYDESAR